MTLGELAVMKPSRPRRGKSAVISALDFAFDGFGFNWAIDPVFFLFGVVGPENFFIGFSDYILFSGFLEISFSLSMYLRLIFMWGVFFIWIVFGPFRYGLFILMGDALIINSDSFFHR